MSYNTNQTINGNYTEQAQAVFDFVGKLSRESPEIAKGFSTLHKEVRMALYLRNIKN